MKAQLFLFDFDGTLTRKDSLFDFLKKTQSHYWLGWGLFLPFFFLAKLGIFSKRKVKERFISFFLKGQTKESLQQLAQQYFENEKNSLLRPNAVQFIWNLPPQDEKYLVSASLDIWLQPFADYLGLKRISTEAEFRNEIFTGKFSTPNCNNWEKVNRIKKEIPLENFQEVKVFGDSAGDKEMYKLATQKFHRYFE